MHAFIDRRGKQKHSRTCTTHPRLRHRALLRRVTLKPARGHPSMHVRAPCRTTGALRDDEINMAGEGSLQTAGNGVQ